MGEEKIVTTARPYGFVPVLVHNGNVVCQMPSGSLINITLTTHHHIGQAALRLSGDLLVHAFYNHLSLLHLDEAWRIAQQLGIQEAWLALGDKALQVLEIDMAIRVYRQLGQPAMVFALEKLSHETEKNLLYGAVAVLFKNFAEAQNAFLHSSRPILALEMRRDLLHWDQALKLAENLAPEQIPFLSKEYALQLEFKGEISHALELYERGVMEVDEAALARRDVETVKWEKILAHNGLCNAGITRNTIRMGQLRAGVNRALDSNDTELQLDCAEILEEMKQYNDAANLFAAAGEYGRAAMIFIHDLKNLNAAQKLLPKVTKPKVFIAYAQAKEKEGQFRDAEAAYEKANEVFDVIRINLEKLNDASKAYKLARQTKSADGSALVAKHAKQLGEWKTTIEFFLLAKQNEEAFEIASTHDAIDAYAECLGDTGASEDYKNIAVQYDQKNEHEKAGDFYFKCDNHPQALRKFLQAPSDASVRKAIQVVGKAHSDTLTHQLIDFLMGGSDGVPKSPKFIFELYLALGNVQKAATIAVIIAKQEQEIGSYRGAHQLLFDTHRDLESNKIPIIQDLRRNLMLLHSYIIAKKLVQLGEHELSARVLIRVSKNINKFPKHTVQILTSTVLECNRVGFHESAFEYASVLVRPEYRKQINEKYKKRIEGLVRRRTKEELVDPDEPSSPCPFCGMMVQDFSLECGNCKSSVPYCIASGRHMVIDDWTCCPSCHFPARYTSFVKYVEAEGQCPMCNQDIAVPAIKKIDKPDPRKGAADDDEPSPPAPPENGTTSGATPSPAEPPKEGS
eukprot:NODE_68_length_2974_cov_11.439316_g52_i0.p1 GENE.NODE_68_length_2974_cov_11.439316_g52_i0~~NODE_68_length_2974_cov_11.439316_g52_i0.p1  ORF type:complete len:933 (+),score=364.97 NODE_68_length_2974_cov_11.439316_g52_i0:413-2800(+)